MNTIYAWRGVRLALLAATLGAARLGGQTPDAGHVPATGGRTLGGHTFALLSTVPLPFVGTSFTSSLGGAMAFDIVEAVTVDVGGTLDTLLPSGNLAFAAVELAYQQRIGTRYAVRGAATLNVRTGTNARMLFAEGLSGLTSFSLGGLATLHRGRQLMVTGSLDLRRGNLTELTPQEFAEYVGTWGIDSLEHWGEHLLHDRRNGRIVAGVRSAWAPKPWLGVSGVIEGGPANLYESGSAASLLIGVAGSVDFRQLRRSVPVGVALALSRTTSPSRADDIFGHLTTANLGIYYTGREEFAIGVDTQWSNAHLVALNENVLTSAFRFVLRYDF